MWKGTSSETSWEELIAETLSPVTGARDDDTFWAVVEKLRELVEQGRRDGYNEGVSDERTFRACTL